MARMRVLLNVDAGELAHEPAELYALAHVVNIACGGHAGDARSMQRVLAACAGGATRAGAHPSYDDREGFGRRALDVAPGVVERDVHAQCTALAEIARACVRECEGPRESNVRIDFMKPHGALYHAANKDAARADAVVRGAARALGPAIVVIGPAGGALFDAATRAGLAYAREGFADRGVHSDGSLLSRGEPGALVHDPALAATRARELVASGAIDTICVHGDTPNALAIARAVRAALEAL